MERRAAQKLYVYVDESGQDTRGELFIVAVVLAGESHERVRESLVRLERHSGKGVRKWVKSTPRQRLAYMTAIVRGAFWAHDGVLPLYA